MASTPVDKRNFYLALSVSDGQALANSVGFAVPSIEVQNHELVDTVQKWMTLAAVGVVDQIRECADWMAEAVVEMQDLSEEEASNTKSVLVCYSVALLSHLIDNELLELKAQDNSVLDLARIDRLLEFLQVDEEFDIQIIDEGDDLP